MHDESISKPGYRLDWERVEAIVAEHFDPQEQQLLGLFFGLEDYEKTGLRDIAKLKKIKLKVLNERLEKLQKQLYKLLKAEDLDELIQTKAEPLSINEEIEQINQ